MRRWSVVSAVIAPRVTDTDYLHLAFYIPPTWMSDTDSTPHSVVEAALLASRLTKSNANRSISHSEIPLIIHQTWKNTQIDTWPEAISDSVERWLEHAVEAPMAYLMWDDDGVIQFLEEFEPSFIDRFSALARNVERSDVFRIMVANYIGGVVSCFSPPPPLVMLLGLTGTRSSTETLILIHYGRRRPGLNPTMCRRGMIPRADIYIIRPSRSGSSSGSRPTALPTATHTGAWVIPIRFS
jgi:hypothetical protein